MRVEITARHCELPSPLKKRVETRIEKLLRFDDRLMDARVVVSFEKNRYDAEAIVKANGMRLVSHAVEDSDKAAVESVLDRLEGQVRRHRDRLVKKHRKATSMGQVVEASPSAPAGNETPAQEEFEAFGEDSDYEGLVTEDPGDMNVSMGLGEAVAMLRASRRDVLGFTSTVSGRPTLVFKRKDGNIGIVDIEI